MHHPLDSAFSKLEPKLPPADQFDVVKASTGSVLPLPVMMTPPKKKDNPVSDALFLFLLLPHLSLSLV